MLITMADKKIILNLRVGPEVRDNFAVAAKLRGASMSGLLHQFIIRTIREERNESPHSFHDPTPAPSPPLDKEKSMVTTAETVHVVNGFKILLPPDIDTVIHMPTAAGEIQSQADADEFRTAILDAYTTIKKQRDKRRTTERAA